jgi:thiamine-phosphate pyrophosphorylase
MTIPKLHYISKGHSPKEHLENIQKASTAGAELVQLDLKNISKKKDYYKIAIAIKADGVHLGKTASCPTIVRKDLYSWQMIGGAANSIQDRKTLIRKEVDYISLGSFRYTSTKDNLLPVLGLNGYTVIIEALKTETPIIGIGGITTEDVAAILKTGIFGIAVSREITQDFNNINVFHKLLNASSTAEQRYTFE